MIASALNGLGGLIAAMTLANRIKEVMGELTPSEFARACGVSPAAVTQWLKGDTKALKADPVALMEAKFGYRASWIVTGKGTKKIEAVDAAWRFTEELQRKVLLLPDEELPKVENILRLHLDMPQKIASDLTNTKQLSSRGRGERSYSVATEDGSGVLDEAEIPAPKQHERKRVQGPARRQGGRSA